MKRPEGCLSLWLIAVCFQRDRKDGGSFINRPGPLGLPTLEEGRETADQKFIKFLL